MTWWLWIKARAVALGAVLLSAAALFLRHKQVKHQRDKARDEAKRLKAIIEMQKKVSEADTELDEAHKSHKAEIKNEAKNGKVDSLSNPNNWD